MGKINNIIALMNRLLFVLALLVTFLLQVFLPRSGNLEISFQPQKLLLLSNYEVGSSYPDLIGKVNAQASSLGLTNSSSLVVPFRLGAYYGFHDRQLNLLSYDVLQDRLPLSHNILGGDFYLDLNSIAGHVVIRDILGTELGRFPNLGNAFVLKNNVYQLSNEGHSLYHYSRKGQQQWRSDLLPYISSLDNNILGATLISYVNGHVVLLNAQGKTENEYISSGSRINGIYGAALSQDSQNIALIAGLDAQRFVFLKKEQGTYLFQYARELTNQLRHSQWLRFSSYSPYVFYSNSEGISIYNFGYKENRLYRSDGWLSHFGEQEESDIQFFVFSTPEWGNLIAIHGTHGEFLRLNLRGLHYSLQIRGHTMYFGQNNLIASYQTQYL